MERMDFQLPSWIHFFGSGSYLTSVLHMSIFKSYVCAYVTTMDKSAV